MNEKRTRASWRIFHCDLCGADVFSGFWSIHQESVSHQKMLRLRTLLQQDCLSFSEIGRRVGLTRERVRQIAARLGIDPGRKRERTCTLNLHEAAWRQRPLIAALIQHLSESAPTSYAVMPIITRKGTFKHNEACIANRWFSLRRYHSYKGNTNLLLFASCSGKPEQWTLWTGPAGWFVFPPGKAPKKSTGFYLRISHPELQAHTTRHDYLDYLEAWHLLAPGVEKTWVEMEKVYG